MTTQNGTTVVQIPTALAKRDTVGAIEPQNMGELQTYAESAAKSGFYGAKNRDQALMIAMTGRDLGLSYSQALRMFHVIEIHGRPPKLVLSADGMVAVCLKHRDVCEYFRIIESDEKHAVVEAKRAGDPARRTSFSVEDAQKAGLVKGGGNWVSWPGRMCLARAKAFLARDLFPDLLAGLYEEGEIQDSVEPRRVEARPARVEPPPSSPVVTEDGEVVDETVIYAGEIEAKIRIAADGDELDAAAAWVARAEREGKVTGDQAKVLAKIGKARRAELK